jgi:anthranilate synthase component I
LRITPDLAQVVAYRGDATHMAVSTELWVDTETPISLYEKLAAEEPLSFLLESAEGGETFGRYSFIGFAPSAVIRLEGSVDPLAELERSIASRKVVTDPRLPRFSGGLVGWLGYDAVRHFERVPVPGGDARAKEDGCFVLAERLVIVDHLKHRVILVDHVPLDGDRADAFDRARARFEDVIARMERPKTTTLLRAGIEAGPPAERGTERAAYVAAVERAKEAIRAGEIFQVVLSQRFTIPGSVSAFAVYRALRALNPSPYMFYLAFDDRAIVGASPEVLVRVEDGEILLRPIAGTRKRGHTRDEDAALEQELRADEKELAEHRMLLDLGRNDVGRVAAIGTVSVERPLHVERYSHVMHLVSDVRAKLAPKKTAFDVLRATFPAGTVSGAPKIRAMELIATLEHTPRQLYSGTVCYFDFSGNMDACIAIRSCIVEKDRAYTQAGAGIVFDSVPEKEDEECWSKAQATLQAIQLAKGRAP